MMKQIKLPEQLVKCKADVCSKLNKIYQEAPILDKQLLYQITRILRKNLETPAEEIASQLKMGRSTLFYKLKKLGIKFNEIIEALKKEAEEEFQKKLERRKIKRLPPRDKEDFLQREPVVKLINRMRTQGLTSNHINGVINYFYRMCKYLGVSPEDFLELPREQVYDLVTQWISDRADEGYNTNADISMIQTIQKWLGVRLLPPGITQKEYKGKFQEAEIDYEHRNKIVNDLLNKYEITNDPIYLKTIQAMAFLFYTGSRRQALGNFTWGDVIRVRTKEFINVFGEDRFRFVSTLEKRGIRWNKLIPLSYVEILPNTPFSPTEIRKIAKILYEAMMKYFDEYNNHTKQYLKLHKIFHIWRHTATRTYLRAFKYNRSLVAKLLGWIKESNLVIYGDYSLLQLLDIMAEEHKIQFVSKELYNRIKYFIKKARLS